MDDLRVRMRWILHSLKYVVAAVSLHTGLLTVIVRRILRGKTTVIMYHRVIDDSRRDLANSNPGIIVSPTTFDMHMRSLRQHFNPIALELLQANIENGVPLPERSCLVTFDDGWIDNYQVAFPIIRKYQIPVTIFLPTDYISANLIFWQEEIVMRLSNILNSGDDDTLKRLASAIDIDCAGPAMTHKDIQRYATGLKTGPDSEVGRVLDYIRAVNCLSDDAPHYNRYLSWDQVEEMRDAGISFASHAQSHQILNKVSDEVCRKELVSSRAILEEKMGSPIRAVAYPNGNYDERVLDAARDAGYVLGFTTGGGLFDSDSDALAIPRNNIHEENARSEAMFVCASINLL